MAATARAWAFGHLPDGRPVPAVTLDNGAGLSATVIAYGATLQSLLMPDRTGRVADITLGHATIDDYLARPQYFGSTVGRFANRLAGGRFAIDGIACRVPCNDGANALHGGDAGFDKQLWDVLAVEEGERASVTLGLVSPDGDQGFPGTLSVEASYALDAGGNLAIAYRAVTDRPTIVNITNHAYWNLSGEGSPAGAMGHELTIPAEHFLPVDAGLIPLGELREVRGTPFDFRAPRTIGEAVRDAACEQIARGRGYDHNWVLASAPLAEPRLCARVHDPLSGRGLELSSNQPGLQFYSGNFLDGTTRGKAGMAYRQGDAIVLEPQNFPDAPNQPGFPDARLMPGETYLNRIRYRFFTG